MIILMFMTQEQEPINGHYNRYNCNGTEQRNERMDEWDGKGEVKGNGGLRT